MNVSDRSATEGHLVRISRVTGPDQVNSILSRLGRFNPMPLRYEPEMDRLEFIIPDDPSFISSEVEFALVMNFMQGHLPVLTFIRVFDSSKRKGYKVGYGRDPKDGRRYRWYPYRRKKQVFFDPEPQPAEALQAA